MTRRLASARGPRHGPARTAAESRERLRRSLAADFAAGWRAEDILLRWLLALPAEIDPALAATAALAQIEPVAADEGAELHRLAVLLAETASWPRPLLAARPRGAQPRERP